MLKPEVWFPVITLILGIVLTGVFDRLKDKRALVREKLARQEQRRDTVTLRRIEFQRATLLEFQTAAAKLARCAGKGHYELSEAARSGTEWSKALVSDELSESWRAANASFQLLRVRIHDEKTRSLGQELVEASSYIGLSQDLATSKKGVDLLGTAYDALLERTGVILRTLDADEDSATII